MSSAPDPAETEIARLVRGAQRGDRVAFAELYQRFTRMVHGIVLARLARPGRNEVDDVVQDVFMTALERILDLREPAAFGEFLPTRATRVRVQTVPPGDGWLRRLLEAFGASGRPRLLVNTSFNGWREPIVCTARDAVRVFYSTGLDVLLVGDFILRK